MDLNLQNVLNINGITDIHVLSPYSFVLKANGELQYGFGKMLDRLNRYYGPYWDFNDADSNLHVSIVDNEEKVKNLRILCLAIRKHEYVMCKPRGIQNFDIKLGYSCNNNCYHCVIKPNLRHIEECYPGSVILNANYGMWCKRDLSYFDVIQQFKRLDWNKIRSICLTGGEPTIRKDFVEILKYLYYNLPNVRIALQTNGRNLSNIALVRSIYRYTRNISFVIALHGLEKTHNEIVNNRKDKGNAFQETIKGIKNLQKIFGKGLHIRAEIVISNKNKNELIQLTRYIYEKLKIREIGYSYPHLDGFTKNEIIDKAPSFKELFPILNNIVNYAYERHELFVAVEAFPECILDKLDKQIVRDMDCNKLNDGSPLVNYLGHDDKDFGENYVNSHKKGPKCIDCVKNSTCYGIWHETFDINKDMLIPLKNKKE